MIVKTVFSQPNLADFWNYYFFFFPVDLLHASQASHSTQSKKKKKLFSTISTTETNSNMWLEDNRNVHASAKIKYGNMKMRGFYYLKQKN